MSLLTEKQISEIIDMATQQSEFAKILKLKLDHWNDNQHFEVNWKIAHPHAEIIMKYAEVAARRIDPWVEFEWFDGCIGEWVNCKDTMCFNFDKYRHIGDNS